MPEETLKDLALKFVEKNPSFIRICMENYFVRWECVEVSQGKITKYEITKLNSKDIKP
jgi:hypothetical protein